MASVMLISKNLVRGKISASSSPTDDAEIDTLIRQVSARFERDCQQPIAERTFEWTFQGTGLPYFTLPFRPITALTKLEYYNGTSVGWVEIDASRYTLVQIAISYRIDYPDGFSEPAQYRRIDGSLTPVYPAGTGLYASPVLADAGAYRVTLTVGYPSDEIPDDLQEVIRDEVVGKWYENARTRDRFDMQSVAVTDQSAYAGKTITLNSTTRRQEWATAVARYSRYW